MTTTTTTKTCLGCAHWNEVSSAKGECRRHAPQLISFEVDADVKIESRFPVTAKEDWCGDFEAK